MKRGNQRDPAKEKYWRHQLRSWSRSGLTVVEYCKARGLNYTQFKNWQREIERRDSKSNGKEDSKSRGRGASHAGASTAERPETIAAFVPVQIRERDSSDTTELATSTEFLEIVLGNGATIRLRSGSPLHILPSVVEILARHSSSG